MSVGLAMVTNLKLLIQIRSRHPSGIYSSEDFIRRVKPGDVFHAISAGEMGIGGVTEHTLGCIKNPVGRPPSRPSLLYEEKYETRKSFVDDLFWGAKACFLDKEKAEAYCEELKRFENELYNII